MRNKRVAIVVMVVASIVVATVLVAVPVLGRKRFRDAYPELNSKYVPLVGYSEAQSEIGRRLHALGPEPTWSHSDVSFVIETMHDSALPWTLRSDAVARSSERIAAQWDIAAGGREQLIDAFIQCMRSDVSRIRQSGYAAMELNGLVLREDVLPLAEAIANDPDPLIAKNVRERLENVKQRSMNTR